MQTIEAVEACNTSQNQCINLVTTALPYHRIAPGGKQGSRGKPPQAKSTVSIFGSGTQGSAAAPVSWRTTMRPTRKSTSRISAFHPSIRIHACTWRCNSCQKSGGRNWLARTAVLSARELFIKHHSSSGEEACWILECAATLVIWIASAEQAVRSSAMVDHKSAFGELILTLVPWRTRCRRRTTDKQSDQIMILTPWKAANLTTRTTANNSALTEVCRRPGSGPESRTLDWRASTNASTTA